MSWKAAGGKAGYQNRVGRKCAAAKELATMATQASARRSRPPARAPSIRRTATAMLQSQGAHASHPANAPCDGWSNQPERNAGTRPPSSTRASSASCT